MHETYSTRNDRNRRSGEADHEEADTKIAYLLQHTVKCRPEEQQFVFIIHSSSGDVDIPVILLGIQTSYIYIYIYIY